MADSTSTIAAALASAREEGMLDAETTEDEGTTEVEDTPVEEESTEETTTEDETTATTDDEGETPEGEDKPAPTEESKPDDKTEEAKTEGTETDTKPKEEGVDEYGLKAKVNGRENRIPYSKTRKIIDNQLTKGYGVVASVLSKAFGSEIKFGKDDMEAVVSKHLADVPKMRERLEGFDQLEPIMRDDPDTFVKILAHSNPKYGKFLTVLEEGYKAPERKAVDEKDDPEPEPDMPLDASKPDGPKTYSKEGWKKREDWVKRGMERSFQKQLDERFAPLDKQNKEIKSAEEYKTQMDTRIRTLMDFSTTKLEGFKDIETQAREGLKEYADLPMEFRLFASAWKALRTKLSTDRNKIRDEVLAEQKKATSVKSTSTPEVVKTVKKEERKSGEGSFSTIKNAVARARAEGKL